MGLKSSQKVKWLKYVKDWNEANQHQLKCTFSGLKGLLQQLVNA